MNFKKIIFVIFGLVATIYFSSNIDVNAIEDHGVNKNFTYTYTTTVDDPITFEELKEEIDLNAYDSFGNNITSNIVVSNPEAYYSSVLNQPTSHDIILGNYQVEYKVYDKNGNYNTFKITIKVIDNKAPVIDEASLCVYEFNKLEVNENTFELIKKGIIVSDNHDYELDYAFDKEFDLLSAIGFNQVNLYVSDKSGNRSSILMEINIEDSVGPKIYADNTYIKTTNTSAPLEIEDIIEMCNIYSIDLETNKNCEITVNYDNYTDNYNKDGVHMIRFQAQDENGNLTCFYVYIEVIDNKEPEFFLSSAKVTITTNVTFDLEKADEIIKSRRMAKHDNYELKVEKDEYTLNKEKTGTYNYQVKAIYEDGTESLFEFIITVEEEIKEKTKEEPEIKEPLNDELTFFEKIKEGFKIIVKVIKWPIERVSKFFRSIFKKSLLFKK